jgi:Phospholipase A2
MIKPNAAAAFILAIATATACTAPTVGTDEEESRWGFAQMVAGTLGVGPGLDLLGYGCYCGPDNDVGVVPVDEVDSCCFTHDHAWMDAGDVAAGCNCNTQAYEYTRPGGVITCTAGQSACATYCCNADKAFSECVQAAGPLDPANVKYDRTTCDPLECVTDDDCEGGTWCNGGRCVPYCGGGGLGHGLIKGTALADGCVDPVDDVDVDLPEAPIADQPVTVTAE